MSGIYNYSREAVRVKVKKCEPNTPCEWRKFSVDPQITSLEVLYSLLAKAFDIKSDFSIKYKALDPSGQETLLAVLSDWDLDAAFLRTHNLSIQTACEPCLQLQVDIKPFTEVKEWDSDSGANSVSSTKDLISPFQQSIGVSQKYVQNMQTKLPGLIMNQMEKTISIVQKALNLSEEPISAHPPRPPLCDSEFRNFLDSVGQILRPDDLKKSIFLGGIDPSLRRVVWKHLLNVYPHGMSGRQRMDYMKKKAAHYYRLREIWKTAIQKGPVVGELSYVTSMVKKDVLRTDRLHPFYAGSDDNQNIAALFNILTTYALNNPSVSYCQGMSDIASPLLVTMNDEAHAYICFCAIMSRLKVNFMLDGVAMTQKFTHLAEAINFYDPEFYEYLKSQQADDLLFCYRWLLLELKREFPFEDSLRMLEVQWSSLKPNPLAAELALVEKEFEPSPPPATDVLPPKSPAVPLQPRENHYTKVCALRRQSSSASLHSTSSAQNLNTSVTHSRLDSTKRLNQSLDENISRITNRYRHSAKAHQSLDETKMIMLMEAAEAVADKMVEAKSASPRYPVGNYCDDSSSQFVFHPTNPFIDDAQLDNDVFEEEEQEGGVTTKNVFIDSESNSTHDEISGLAESPKDLNKQNNVVNNNSSAILPKNVANAIAKKSGGHFRDLKEKIVASKKGSQSNESLCSPKSSDTPTTDPPLKLVKNFNEFLNFASMNKSRVADKVATNNNPQQSATKKHQHPHPLVKLTKRISSVDESDSSTADSCSDITMNGHREGFVDRPLSLDLTSSIGDDFEKSVTTDCTPEDIQDQEYYPMTTSMTRELRLELENLDRQVFGKSQAEIRYEKLGKESTMDLIDDLKENEIIPCPDISDLILRRKGNEDASKRISTCSSTNADVFVWENPLHKVSPGCNKTDEVSADILKEDSDSDNPEGNWKTSDTLNPFIAKTPQIEITNGPSSKKNYLNDPALLMQTASPSKESPSSTTTEITFSKSNLVDTLPPPHEFGGGNPFLIFLCLTLLLQHRNTIIKSGMDYNEIAMHFDKMVRKHDVTRVLNQARRMYVDYLKTQNILNLNNSSSNKNNNYYNNSNSSSQQSSNATKL